MNRSKINRHSLPKPDDRGRVRPYVGVMPDGTKARFTVGDRRTSHTEMERRLNLIRTLYEGQCSQGSGHSSWLRWTHQVAQRIAAGNPVVDEFIGCEPCRTAGVVAQLRSWGIPVVTNELSQAAFAEGLVITQDTIAREVQRQVAAELNKLRQNQGAVVDAAQLPADPLAMVETATLHEALDAFKKHRESIGGNNTSTSTKKCLKQLTYLKQAHEDCPLWQLDLPKIQTMVAYWRNRPQTRKGRRCSWDHAHDMLKEMFCFFRWLEDCPNYKWTMPKGAERISRSPIDLPSDQKHAFQTITKNTFTPEQLAIIAAHADPFGRALVGLCVNCAFGASEVGQWSTSNYQLHMAHPHADKVGFPSTQADSWVVGPRPKTGVYGEHLLWPQVADAIEPFLDGRPFLPMTRNGQPWWKAHSANPQTSFANWWNRLLDRVQETDQNFPRLPFGSLRDLLPNLLRAEYSDEVAQLALQHGKNKTDDLLDCYANIPYRKLFEATREMEPKFKAFLDAL